MQRPTDTTTPRRRVAFAAACLVTAIGLSACGDDSPSTGGGDAGMSLTVTIASNHGHVANVTMADVTAAADKTYDIQGSAGHTHSVTVTAADFATLTNTGSVTITSTTAVGHSHAVTITV